MPFRYQFGYKFYWYKYANKITLSYLPEDTNANIDIKFLSPLYKNVKFYKIRVFFKKYDV